MKYFIAPIAVLIITIALLVALAGAAFAQEPQGRLVLMDATGHPIRAIFRPSPARASNGLMIFEDRCIEIFDLDGDHLHWAPYDLVSGAIAYYPSPCRPSAVPKYWLNSNCTLGLVEPDEGVRFYGAGHQTVAASSSSSPITTAQAYTMSPSGGCDLVVFVAPRDFVAVRPMTDTHPWPVTLPGKKPFRVEVVYD